MRAAWERDVVDALRQAAAITRSCVEVGHGGSTRRGAVAEKIQRALSLTSERMEVDASPIDEIAGTKSLEGKVDVVERAVAALSERPLARLHVAILAARASARAPITHREASVATDGSLAWVSCGSVRALMLFATHEALRVACAVFGTPMIETAAAREPSRGSPFRDAAREDIDVRDRSLDLPRVRRHLERALLLTAVIDASQSPLSKAEANPYSLRSAAPIDRWSDEFTELIKLAIRELALASSLFARNTRDVPELACGALVIDVIALLAELHVDTFDAGVRRVLGAIDELGAALESSYGFEGTASTLVASAMVAASGGANPRASPAMRQLAHALGAAIESAPGDARPAVAWPWCDEYFLVTVASPSTRPKVRWRDYIFTREAGDVFERERRWRVTARFIGSLRSPSPSGADAAKAALLSTALGGSAAAVFFALPALRVMVRGIQSAEREASTEAFGHDLVGTAEAADVFAAWARLALVAFTFIRPHGELLERWVETTLYGSAPGEWPELTTFAERY